MEEIFKKAIKKKILEPVEPSDNIQEEDKDLEIFSQSVVNSINNAREKGVDNNDIIIHLITLASLELEECVFAKKIVNEELCLDVAYKMFNMRWFLVNHPRPNLRLVTENE